MDNVINDIISLIPKGCVFDAHTIIQIMLEQYSDEYLSNYCKGSTNLYHGYISECIAKLNGKGIEQKGMSWSRNIHGKYSLCTYWVKV